MPKFDNDYEVYTNNLSSSKIGALETLKEARVGGLSLFDRRRMSDICESRFHLQRLCSRIYVEAHQRISSHVNLVASNRIPWRLRSEVGGDEERDGPDPLEDKGDAPSEISCHIDDGSYNTR